MRRIALVAQLNATATWLVLESVFGLITFAPITRSFELSPSQKAMYSTFFHFVIFAPISLMTFSIVKPCAPSIRVESPCYPKPVDRDVEARRVSPIALFAFGSRCRAVATAV